MRYTIIAVFLLVIGCQKVAEKPERTAFERQWWTYAETQIPKGAEVVSIEPCGSRIEMIGVFYRFSGEQTNTYKAFPTKIGKMQKMLIEEEFNRRREMIERGNRQD